MGVQARFAQSPPLAELTPECWGLLPGPLKKNSYPKRVYTNSFSWSHQPLWNCKVPQRELGFQSWPVRRRGSQEKSRYFPFMRQVRAPTFNFGTPPEWCLICIPSYELRHSSHRSIRSLTALICCGFSLQFKMKSKDRVWHITISLSLQTLELLSEKKKRERCVNQESICDHCIA